MKIKHLHIFSKGRNFLNNLSKRNKIIAGALSGAIALGSGAYATSSVIKYYKADKNLDTSIIMEDDNTDDKTIDFGKVYGPELKAEIYTENKKDKKEEDKDEFLSDKLKKVEIKDAEDKKNEDVKQEINGKNEDTITVDDNNVAGYVAVSNGEEIVEKVEYSGDGFVVDGVAYETLEDANRNSQVGNIEFVDNTQYYPGANGEYYLTQEDADNSYKVEYFDNNEVVETVENNEVVDEVISDEINTDSGFYYDEENNIRWASYEDYLMVTNPSYYLESLEANYSDEVVEENEITEEVSDVEITDEYDEIVYGPDGEIYPSIDAYNEAMAQEVASASNEEVKEETVVEEKTEETKVEETKEETKTEEKVVEEKTEETVVEEKTEEVKEETTEEVSEETTEEVSEAKEESDEYLDELLSDEGWLAPDGNWWTSEEEYLLVVGQQNQDTVSKSR